MSEQQFTQAKQKFAKAKKEYFEDKEKALKDYNKQKDMGITEDSWGQWTGQGNAPKFSHSLQTLEQAAAEVINCARAQAKGGDPWSVIEQKEYRLVEERDEITRNQIEYGSAEGLLL